MLKKNSVKIKKNEAKKQEKKKKKKKQAKDYVKKENKISACYE